MSEKGVIFAYDQITYPDREVRLYFYNVPLFLNYDHESSLKINAEVYLKIKEFREMFGKVLQDDFQKTALVLDDGSLLELRKREEDKIEIYVEVNSEKVGDIVRLSGHDDYFVGEYQFGILVDKNDFERAYEELVTTYQTFNN